MHCRLSNTQSPMAPVPLLLRGLSLLRLHLHEPLAGGATLAPRRLSGTLTGTSSTDPGEKEEEIPEFVKDILRSTESRPLEKIRREIKPITDLVKDILHSKRYLDGEVLNAEDEKAVTENLLLYHPHYEDKIGPGLSCIIVDRHHIYRWSRCFYAVRTDGECEDFSYMKCLLARYPEHAQSFIKKYPKR